jgi:hypothetical protein
MAAGTQPSRGRRGGVERRPTPASTGRGPRVIVTARAQRAVKRLINRRVAGAG